MLESRLKVAYSQIIHIEEKIDVKMNALSAKFDADFTQINAKYDALFTQITANFHTCFAQMAMLVRQDHRYSTPLNEYTHPPAKI